MCYSGIYIKENATLEDFQEIIKSIHSGLLSMRDSEAKMKIYNEEIRKMNEEHQKMNEESDRLYKESGGTVGTSGRSGRSGTSGSSSSTNSKEYISVMISQAYYVANRCPSDWIDMWREEFKDEPDVLVLLDKQLI